MEAMVTARCSIGALQNVCQGSEGIGCISEHNNEQIRGHRISDRCKRATEIERGNASCKAGEGKNKRNCPWAAR